LRPARSAPLSRDVALSAILKCGIKQSNAAHEPNANHVAVCLKGTGVGGIRFVASPQCQLWVPLCIAVRLPDLTLQPSVVDCCSCSSDFAWPFTFDLESTSLQGLTGQNHLWARCFTAAKSSAWSHDHPVCGFQGFLLPCCPMLMLELGSLLCEAAAAHKVCISAPTQSTLVP
jgi:hypothetical protein